MSGNLVDKWAELLEDLVAESSLNIGHLHNDVKLTNVSKDFLCVPDELLLEERANEFLDCQKLLNRDHWSDYLVKLQVLSDVEFRIDAADKLLEVLHSFRHDVT